MSAITTSQMKKEIFDLWESKMSLGIDPVDALREILTERPDLRRSILNMVREVMAFLERLGIVPE